MQKRRVVKTLKLAKLFELEFNIGNLHPRIRISHFSSSVRVKAVEIFGMVSIVCVVYQIGSERHFDDLSPNRP